MALSREALIELIKARKRLAKALAEVRALPSFEPEPLEAGAQFDDDTLLAAGVHEDEAAPTSAKGPVWTSRPASEPPPFPPRVKPDDGREAPQSDVAKRSTLRLPPPRPKPSDPADPLREAVFDALRSPFDDRWAAYWISGDEAEEAPQGGDDVAKAATEEPTVAIDRPGRSLPPVDRMEAPKTDARSSSSLTAPPDGSSRDAIPAPDSFGPDPEDQALDALDVEGVQDDASDTTPLPDIEAAGEPETGAADIMSLPDEDWSLDRDDSERDTEAAWSFLSGSDALVDEADVFDGGDEDAAPEDDWLEADWLAEADEDEADLDALGAAGASERLDDEEAALIRARRTAAQVVAQMEFVSLNGRRAALDRLADELRDFPHGSTRRALLNLAQDTGDESDLFAAFALKRQWREESRFWMRRTIGSETWSAGLNGGYGLTWPLALKLASAFRDFDPHDILWRLYDAWLNEPASLGAPMSFAAHLHQLAGETDMFGGGRAGEDDPADGLGDALKPYQPSVTHPCLIGAEIKVSNV